MASFALCPAFIEKSCEEKALFLNVLMELIQDNNAHRIYMDSDNILLSAYKEKAENDSNGLLKVWLNLLASEVATGTVDVISFLNPSTDPKNTIINMLASVYFDRNLVSYSKQDYLPLGSSISSYKIGIFDKYEIVRFLGSGSAATSFSSVTLLKDLVRKTIRMAERKHTTKLEDLHNDELVNFLRDRSYIVTDQTRSGTSGSGTAAGELDAMIRDSSGTPVSIIEAFRLNSCGPSDSIISAHINKLVHRYDTSGLPTNFVVVYAEAADFGALWDKYKLYITELNNKPDYESLYPFVSFDDTNDSVSEVAAVRVGRSTHSRNGALLEVFHIFVDMHV